MKRERIHHIHSINLKKTLIMINKAKQNKVTPSRGGLVYNEKDSPQIQKSLRTWKAFRKEREPDLDNTSAYWKQQSACSAL